MSDSTPTKIRVIDDPFTFWWGMAWLLFGFFAGLLLGAWLW